MRVFAVDTEHGWTIVAPPFTQIPINNGFNHGFILCWERILPIYSNSGYLKSSHLVGDFSFHTILLSTRSLSNTHVRVGMCLAIATL